MGWLQDPALLERLAIEKLAREAETLRSEGWKWIEAAVEFPYGHTAGLRRLAGYRPPLTDEEQASSDALRAEYDTLEQSYSGAEDLPEEADRRLSEIETALDALDNRPTLFDPAEIARAGVFVSIDGDGDLRIERGYVRSEDEAPNASSAEGESKAADTDGAATGAAIVQSGHGAANTEAAEEEDGIKPLPDRLVTELTAHRTLALRDALANDTDTAFVAVLHALCLNAFYHYSSETCLEITAKSASFGAQAPGLKDSAPAKGSDERHTRWADQLPRDAGDLWDTLIALDGDRRASLFAHCASLSINAVHEPWNRNPRRLIHAERLASALRLDMAAAGWAPTVDNYLGRVTKARILEAVREAKGEAAAQLIDHLKKPDMAKEAERLLAGSGWLPEPLRMPAPETSRDEQAATELPAFLDDEGSVAEAPKSDELERPAIAAE
jgi:ParB family chromosome partitioning protein